MKSLQAADAHRWMMNPESPEPYELYDSTMMSITQQIQALDDETCMIVDLGGGRNWRSTRLYFLASLLVDLTDVRRPVFVDREKRFFGVSSAVAVRDILAKRVPALRHYGEQLSQTTAFADLDAELPRRGTAWMTEMQRAGGESTVKTWVRKQELRRLLGDALIQRAVDGSVGEKEQSTRILDVVDQVIKWPRDLVPIVRDEKFFKVVERDALTEELAGIFVKERLRGPF